MFFYFFIFYLIAILALRVKSHSLQERNVLRNVVLIVDHHVKKIYTCKYNTIVNNVPSRLSP